jgi:hypothetical protein
MVDGIKEGTCMKFRALDEVRQAIEEYLLLASNDDARRSDLAPIR